MVIGYVFVGIVGGLLTVMTAVFHGHDIGLALALYPVGGTAAALCLVLTSLLFGRPSNADHPALPPSR